MDDTWDETETVRIIAPFTVWVEAEEVEAGTVRFTASRANASFVQKALDANRKAWDSHNLPQPDVIQELPDGTA